MAINQEKYNRDHKTENKEWSGMSRKARVKALDRTGSWKQDYKIPLGKMGGSQQEAVTGYVKGSIKKKKEAVAKKMKFEKKYHQVSNEQVGRGGSKIKVGFYKNKKGEDVYEKYNSKFDK